MGDGLYRVRVSVRGKRRVIATKLTLKEAKEHASAWVAIRNERAVREGVTLSTFGPGFLERRRKRGLRAARHDVNRWENYIASDPIAGLAIAGIDHTDVIAWRDRLEERGLARQTQKNALNLLRRALKEAVDRGLAPVNVARDVEVETLGKGDHRNKWRILNLDEQRRLIAVVPLDDRPLVVAALFTGLRQGELFRLEWPDVRDLDDRARVLIRNPKNGKNRTVPLLEPARAAFQEMASRNLPTPIVFPGYRKRTKRAYETTDFSRRGIGDPRRWEKWVKAAGLGHVRWHDLRHTCATSLLAGRWGRKWTLDEVRDMLGHSSVQVTERYAHAVDETLDRAVGETRGATVPTLSDGPGALAKKTSDSESQHPDLNRRPAVYEPTGLDSGSGELTPKSVPGIAKARPDDRFDVAGSYFATLARRSA